MRNQVKLRFTRVVSALNLVPGVFDDSLMQKIKNTGYFTDSFLDKLIENFNPDEYNPDVAASIISDEFLKELLERRSTPEFKNIVFSIQKKQGEIIQAPYQKNMIVQGCAGSGKSMIMLHRLPIILYDNPTSLSRSNLYIITPSQMYIQMAENMRAELEISDIKMGTIEQYYDYCIQKYIGHVAGEYGKINNHIKLAYEKEKYIYSKKCVEDIQLFLDKNSKIDMTFLDKAIKILSVELDFVDENEDYLHQIRNRIINCQKIINANNEVLSYYFAEIRKTLDALYRVSNVIKNRKDNVKKSINKKISEEKMYIKVLQKKIANYNPIINARAIENRNIKIENTNDKIKVLQNTLEVVDSDIEYFDFLLLMDEKIQEVLNPFEKLNREFSQNEDSVIYEAINNIGKIIGGFYMISWEISKIEDKYSEYLESIGDTVKEAQLCIEEIQNIKKKYLDYNYFKEVKNQSDLLKKNSENIINDTYVFIMNKIGVIKDSNGNIRALNCSPYLYLQILYQFQGTPNNVLESFLSIDEAQGIAPEEIRLLYNINSRQVTFNMFGDVHQHIDGTKGIDSWSDYKDIIKFDMYEMQENYRNPSQITNFCNKEFEMEMLAINTPGKGVHEIASDEEFFNEMISQLLDTRRTGLAAILVANDMEARYLLNRFGAYADNFQDMTIEESSFHRTRWNIINIDDAKGLEFSTVFVLSGRMSKNEKYVAYTRALDELFVYSDVIDVTGMEKKTKNREVNEKKTNVILKEDTQPLQQKHVSENTYSNIENSKVREFLENSGFEVIDNRKDRGRLWIIGEKTDIRAIVNEAIAKFGISGKYASTKETNFRNGWYTKTNK